MATWISRAYGYGAGGASRSVVNMRGVVVEEDEVDEDK